MSIYEYDEEKHMRQEREAERAAGIAEGIEMGIERGIKCGGIQAIIQDNLEEGKSKEVIIGKLIKRFELTEEEAEAYFAEYA